VGLLRERCLAGRWPDDNQRGEDDRREKQRQSARRRYPHLDGPGIMFLPVTSRIEVLGFSIISQRKMQKFGWRVY
jgi:hypothetical protein